MFFIKKKMKKITILITVLLMVSCKPLAKIIFHVKSPDFETIDKQRKFLKKNKVFVSDFFYFKDFNSFTSASKNRYLSIPDAFFFNKEGNLVRYKKSSSDCNAKVGDFINDLKEFSNAPSDSSININKLLPLFESESKIEIKKTDVTVFLTWAVFAGKVNKNKTFEWIKLLEKAKSNGINISFYLINCDLQDSWNLTNEQKNKIIKLIKINS